MAVDFSICYEKFSTLISDFEKLRDNLQEVCEDICAIQRDICTSTDWIGNGREECAVYLALVAKYCGCLCAKNVGDTGTEGFVVSGILSSSEVEGKGEHINQLISTLSEYRVIFEKFEKNGNGAEKAEAIKMLDNMQ